MNKEKTTVTTEVAKKWLDRHTALLEATTRNQRNIRPRVVERYAQDMRAGKWLYGPMPIVIGPDGWIIDGQHRLAAVVSSGKAQDFDVVFGWVDPGGSKPKLIDVIDGNAPRSIACRLQINGVASSSLIVAILNSCVQICHSGNDGLVTVATAQTLLDKIGFQSEIDDVRRRFPMGNSGWLFGPLVWVNTFDKAAVQRFATGYFNMEASRGSPAHALMRWVRDAKTPHTDLKFRVACLCLAAEIEEKTVQLIRPSREPIDFLANMNKPLKLKVQAIAPSKR